MKLRVKSIIWNTNKNKIFNQNNKNFKKSPQNKDWIRSFWDNLKWTNILNHGVPEGQEIGEAIENLFEKIMRENFPNLVKEIDMQVHEFMHRESQTWEMQWTTHHN